MRIFRPKETGTSPKTVEEAIYLLNVMKASRHDVASQIEIVERVAGSSVWLRELRLAAELFSLIEGSDVKSVSSAALLAMVKVLRLEKASADILSLIAGKIDTFVRQSEGIPGMIGPVVLLAHATLKAASSLDDAACRTIHASVGKVVVRLFKTDALREQPNECAASAYQYAFSHLDWRVSEQYLADSVSVLQGRSPWKMKWAAAVLAAPASLVDAKTDAPEVQAAK